MLSLLLLPIKLAVLLVMGLLFLPFLLLRLVFKAVFALLLLPFVLLFVAGGVLLAVLALSFAVLLPLLPFAFIAFCVWLMMRPRIHHAALG
jgi:hypothetical protein